MDKAESKYQHTAARMDQAFLELLSKKDFTYITVKEVCEAAGVHRSTFYLHYETIADLLEESVAYMNRQFRAYYDPAREELLKQLEDCPLDDLNLVTPEYLMPYLQYIKDNKRLFQTALKHSRTLYTANTYERMYHYVFAPILRRWQVPEWERAYVMRFYISGLMAIISEWLVHDCETTIEELITVIQRCVPWGHLAPAHNA